MKVFLFFWKVVSTSKTTKKFNDSRPVPIGWPSNPGVLEARPDRLMTSSDRCFWQNLSLHHILKKKKVANIISSPKFSNLKKQKKHSININSRSDLSKTFYHKPQEIKWATNKKTSYFPLYWLFILGILIMVYYNPHITGWYFIPYKP